MAVRSYRRTELEVFCRRVGLALPATGEILSVGLVDTVLAG
jgi:hypothetical protein